MSCTHDGFMTVLRIEQLRKHGRDLSPTELELLCTLSHDGVEDCPCFCLRNEICKLEVRNNTWRITDEQVIRILDLL